MMPAQYRCLYCDIWLPEKYFQEHMKDSHNVSKHKVVEEFVVRVIG